jgi:hypothetical protein
MGCWNPGFSVAAPATCLVALRARMRRCRLPIGSPAVIRAEEEQVRAIGLDVHLEPFAESLEGEDRVALRFES